MKIRNLLKKQYDESKPLEKQEQEKDLLNSHNNLAGVKKITY